MSKEAFVTKRFNPAALAVIRQANQIIASYQDAGFTMTLRQLYYQFVARDIFPKDRLFRKVGPDKWVRDDANGTPNATPNYKWLGTIINDARLAGLVDWTALEDRTRFERRVSTWASPESIISAVADQYKEDLWALQKYRPFVWIEKDALLGVLEPPCERWRAPYFACRGNTSASAMYEAAKRMADVRRNGQIPIVFHLGDHDPSGIDMTRDNRERLAMIARFDIEVRRLALNMDQIEEYNPPPNPAKDTDSRYAAYVAEFETESSWELDALAPDVISDIIDEAMGEIVNTVAWRKSERNEERQKNLLLKVSNNWQNIVADLA